MSTQRARRGTAQAQDVVDITNALNELRLIMENRVINTVNTILDVANNTAALIQERFRANADGGGNAAADIPAQNRIPKPRGTITNNHILTLLQEQIPLICSYLRSFKNWTMQMDYYRIVVCCRL
jgi:hypothetical protein